MPPRMKTFRPCSAAALQSRAIHKEAEIRVAVFGELQTRVAAWKETELNKSAQCLLLRGR